MLELGCTSTKLDMSTVLEVGFISTADEVKRTLEVSTKLPTPTMLDDCST